MNEEKLNQNLKSWGIFEKNRLKTAIIKVMPFSLNFRRLFWAKIVPSNVFCKKSEIC